MTKLYFHRSPSGDWTVVKDQDGKTVYEGHRGMNDLVVDLLDYLAVEYEDVLYENDEEYEERFC